MFSWIWWLIIGLVVGLLARLIMPGRDAMGLIATMILGIVGSLVGGFVSSLIWPTTGTRFQPAGFLMSLVGAIIVLALWKMIRSRTTT
jgi:uncharacterized membrane protein YeaQ/YmgE (transglycosylase-associated protein family)